MQAERRLERSRNATTAAVPLTEAQRDCVFFIPSATSAREAAAERALVAAILNLHFDSAVLMLFLRQDESLDSPTSLESA